jgi:hypothetical protein
MRFFKIDENSIVRATEHTPAAKPSAKPAAKPAAAKPAIKTAAKAMAPKKVASAGGKGYDDEWEEF